MQKRIPITAAIAAVLFFAVAAAQTTYIVLHDRYEAEYLALSRIGGSDGPTDVTTADASSDNSTQEFSRTHVTPTQSDEFMDKLINKLGEVNELYRSNYINELDDERLIDSAVAGYVAGTGDDFGAYYNEEAFKLFVDDIVGEVAGIGVNVIYNTDYDVIEVLNVVQDSPALEAGVLPGDLIVYIGDEKELVSELGYYPSINKLRGEVGSHAVFTVRRGENYSEELSFDVVRRVVDSISVMKHVYALDSSVGVIKITGFDRNTPEQFFEAVDTLKKEGCDKLVIDLRYNPGGELLSIVSILDYILPEGPIVRIFDADGEEVKRYSSDKNELDMKMSVLVNKKTASAAELFTSSVRDYNKATIVGITTYGKGCIQSTVPLMSGGAVSVTYRMYNPPFSDNYHGIGIIPDIEVELDEALSSKNIYKITDEEDNQLAKAVEALYN